MGDWYHGHLIWHCPRSGALYGAKICSVTPSRCLCGTRTASARVQTFHLGVWHRDYPEVKTTSSAAHTHSVLRTVRPGPSVSVPSLTNTNYPFPALPASMNKLLLLHHTLYNPALSSDVGQPSLQTPFPSSPAALRPTQPALGRSGRCKHHHHHHHHRRCQDACCISPETVVCDVTRQTSATRRQGPFDAASMQQHQRVAVSSPVRVWLRCAAFA